MENQRKKQENIERIASLIQLFLVHKNRGLTRKEILEKLKSFYYSDSKEPQSAERLFERDKQQLKDLGIHLEVIYKDKNFTYRLSDFSYESFQPKIFTPKEKEELSNRLLQAIQNHQNSKQQNLYLKIYMKLFFKDENILKKLLQLNHQKLLNKKTKEIFNTQQNFTKLLTFMELIAKKQALSIQYKKKEEQIIQREIFPLRIYVNRNIYYLMAWDYNRKQIRNFLISNILQFQSIPFSDRIQKVQILDSNASKKQKKDIIWIPKHILITHIPHPLNIRKFHKPIEITITIKKEYMTIYEDFFRMDRFFRIDFHKQITQKGYMLTFSTTNPEALFYFLIRYPDSFIDLQPELIVQAFQQFLKKKIQFYEHYI